MSSIRTRTTVRGAALRGLGGAVAVLALAAAVAFGLALVQPAAPAHAAPAPAPGGTIVFVKGYNVWIARGDGTGQRAVTTNGTYEHPYRSPTQSDAGIVAASHGNLIYRMDQSGKVLSTMDPPALMSSVSHPIDGVPVNLAISPDGKTIAYTFTSYECPVGASCGARSATGYTAADHLTPPAARGTTFFDHPSWVGNNRTLQTGGYGSQVMVHDLGKAPFHWFDDSDYAFPSTDVGNSELSRDGKWLAAVRGYGTDAYIIWYAVSGDARSGPAPAVPAYRCLVGYGENLSLTDPTWSPDSKQLLWTEPGNGIWVVRDVSHEECDVAPARLVPGGSEPSWSPAALSAPARPSAPSKPAKHTTPLKNVKKPTITGRPRVGRTLKAKPGTWRAKPASYSDRWYRGGKAIKHATKKTYTVKKADRGKKLTVRVTAKRSGYRATTITSKAVKVKKR